MLIRHFGPRQFVPKLANDTMHFYCHFYISTPETCSIKTLKVIIQNLWHHEVFNILQHSVKQHPGLPRVWVAHQLRRLVVAAGFFIHKKTHFNCGEEQQAVLGQSLFMASH